MKAPRFILQSTVLFAAITAFAAIAMANPPSFARKWGQPGLSDGQFSSPHGLCLSSSGEVFVADFGNDRVQKHNVNGDFLGAFGGNGIAPGRFENPRDVAVDATGTLYVCDDHGIQVFDSAFGFLRSWTTGGQVAEHLALSPSGDRLYAGSGPWVIVYDRDGNFLNSWRCAAPAGAVRSALAVGPSGSVYVALDRAQKVRKYTADGAFVVEWGDLGQDAGEFVDPQAIAVDGDENVYVGDRYSRLQKFSASGKFLEGWGAFGSGDGECQDIGDLATDATGNLYVLDQELARVQVFDSGTVPVTPTSWGALKLRYR